MGDNDKPYEKDAMDYTPEGCLLDAINDIQKMRAEGKPEPSKAFVMLLWDEPDNTYGTQFFNAGMKCSEVISLLEITKLKIMSIGIVPLRYRDEDEEEKE